jgi:hypothetical protein
MKKQHRNGADARRIHDSSKNINWAMIALALFLNSYVKTETSP